MLRDFLATRIRNPDALAWIRSEIGDPREFTAALLEACESVVAGSPFAATLGLS
jgi:hypothetical protein